MPVPHTKNQMLGAILTGAADSLDIPPNLRAEAVARYDDLSAFLATFADERGGAGWSIYTQGSFRLGTVTRPAHRTTEYDLDLVCRHNVDFNNISRVELKELVGEAIAKYRADRGADTMDLEPGKRCWTLTFDGFHLDILPAVPAEVDEPASTAIRITDTSLSRWQISDPIAFSNWFRDCASEEYKSARLAMAAERGSSIEAVPDRDLKTNLQRIVQITKMHRDQHFGDDPTCPPSVVLTTLIAKAYVPGRDLVESLAGVISRMPDHIEQRQGRLWVPNPLCDEENLADRWGASDDAEIEFASWLRRIDRDLREAAGQTGVDMVTKRLGAAFGTSSIAAGTSRLGDEFRTTRERGQLLTSGATATLGANVGRVVPAHNFYGDG